MESFVAVYAWIVNQVDNPCSYDGNRRQTTFIDTNKCGLSLNVPLNVPGIPINYE